MCSISNFSLSNSDIQSYPLPEYCGICHKKGIEIAWPNHLSKGAHKKCFEEFLPYECLINLQLMKSFKLNKKLADKCHRFIIREILKDFFFYMPNGSILAYLNCFTHNKLKEQIKSVLKDAIAKFCVEQIKLYLLQPPTKSNSFNVICFKST